MGKIAHMLIITMSLWQRLICLQIIKQNYALSTKSKATASMEKDANSFTAFTILEISLAIKKD
jgi:hypothetical protein